MGINSEQQNKVSTQTSLEFNSSTLVPVTATIYTKLFYSIINTTMQVDCIPKNLHTSSDKCMPIHTKNKERTNKNVGNN